MEDNVIEFINVFKYLSKSIIILRDKKLYDKCDKIVHKLLNILFRFFHINKYIFYVYLFFDVNVMTFIELPNDKHMYEIIKNRFKIDGSDINNINIKIYNTS
ncbi:unknown similar to AMEV008 [Choristoneura rosaceana entomopoxvirus 'L']|uniref:N1R/p28-like protein n=1 Tax=Choristoneura rosaceana entomopoxvirus 'L' TaxID=1293539 RepID=A0ABM9QK67_9POXV|nr:unknown similar to AMEV008 [Choristoneura rosaceana entomopoxvirus 'L']CCU55925.1 unknown similar to AMEV008 [Choristoneura rosaceana entomopoxvirus 'L']